MRNFTCIGAALAAAMFTAPAAFGYGALAIGGSTADAQYGFAAGYSWNHPTREAAEAKAMEQCRKYPSKAPDQTNAKCAIIANFSNAWLVIAMDPDAGQTGFGYSINADRAMAESNAMGQCRASSLEQRKSHCAIAGAKHDEIPPLPAAPSTVSGEPKLTPPPKKKLLGMMGALSLEICLKEGTPPEDTIRRCTTVIRSGQLHGPDLATIYNRRALAYYALHDYDNALDDLDRAILSDRFNPVYSDNRKIVAAAAGK